LLEEMSFMCRVKLRYGKSKYGNIRVELVSLRRMNEKVTKFFWKSVPENRCVMS